MKVPYLKNILKKVRKNKWHLEIHYWRNAGWKWIWHIRINRSTDDIDVCDENFRKCLKEVKEKIKGEK